MNYSEHFNKYGTLPTFHLEDEPVIDNGKPSSFIFKNKKKYQKTIKILKDIEQNHNHSWYKDVYNDNKNRLNNEALFYRGRSISFKEMFENIEKYANALYNIGIRQGDEIACCLSNTPEAAFLLLALNKIGAVFNHFNKKRDNEELIKLQISNTSKKIFFTSDNIDVRIIRLAEKLEYEKIVVFSLADSIPFDYKEKEEYVKEYDDMYCYVNKVPALKDTYKNILSVNDFLSFFNDSIAVSDNNNLDTPFLITTTSGTTSENGWGIITHTNRSLITTSVFTDSRNSGDPGFKAFRQLAILSLSSNTSIIPVFANSFVQGYSVALEPDFAYDNLLPILLINRPNIVSVTSATWVNTVKAYYLNKSFYNISNNPVRLPFLFACIAVGEPLTHGEEVLCNRFFKDVKAGKGVKIKKLFSFPRLYISVGGGNSEFGGFYRLFLELHKKMHPFLYNRNMPSGFRFVPFSTYTALKQNANGDYVECDYNEPGILVVNTAASFKGYTFDGTKTKNTIIKDVNGREWLSFNVYGFVDKLYNLHMLGRITEKKELIELYCRLQKHKDILSCSLVEANNVVHIVVQKQIFSNITDEKFKSNVIKYSGINNEDFGAKYKIDILPIIEDYPYSAGYPKRGFLELKRMVESRF